jgi:hypothetical protein
MRQFFICMLALAGAVLVGCMQERLDDVSNEPEYKEVLGARYEVISSVDAFGIRDTSVSEVEYVTLIPPPGIEGYEVAFRLPIKVGSKVTVLSVMKSNRWPDPNMTLIVQVDGTIMPTKKEIRIDLFRGNEGEGKGVLLNPKIYRKLV